MITAAFKYVPQPPATTFALPSLFILILCSTFVKEQRQKIADCMYNTLGWLSAGVGLIRNGWHGSGRKKGKQTIM